MYLKHIAIKNIGPISELNIKLPFTDEGNPKPILFVGENGTGKTILLSQIIDAFYEIGGEVFSNVKVTQGVGYKYFKISGGINLKVGENKGFSTLQFEENGNKIEYLDKVNKVEKEDITQLISDFSLSPNSNVDNQKLITDIKDPLKKDIETSWLNGAYFYQPAYRYEEPFWKVDEFKSESVFSDENRYSGELKKEIEIISSNKENKQFLLDLILDNILSQQNINSLLSNNPDKELKDKSIVNQIGSNIYNIQLWANINIIIQKIKQNDSIVYNIGERGKKRVSIINKDTNELLPLNNLSLGESVLLNLFTNIIRHACQYRSLPLDKITGIVAIDEIDIHLHTDLQKKVLPQLIKLFPKVQFIITTHSPLFLLGMEKEFGKDGIEIRKMPGGELITSERFSEFEKAYKALKETEKFDNEIQEHIKNSSKPIVFVEGDYDIRYIKRACELLGKQELFDKLTFIDADGYKNLNKIWQHKTNLFKAIPQKMMLLYDCDTKIKEEIKDNIHKKIIPYREKNLFDRGIENLFPKETINKAIEHKKAFIDYTSETKQTKRGAESTIPEKYEINPDEKGNFCNWLCENGTKEDFIHFNKVFEIFEEFLRTEGDKQ